MRLNSRRAGAGWESQCGTVGVMPGQLGVGGHDTQFLRPGEDLLAVGVPARVELPGMPVRPLLRDMVRRVCRAEAQVQVERLVRISSGPA